LVLASGVGAIVLVLLVAATVAYVALKWSNVAREDVALDPVSSGEPENYLIVGSDTREGIDPGDPDAKAFVGGETPTGRRSDTIMVVRVDPGARQIRVLSLPRDLWVPIAGTGANERINTAYSHDDGPQRLIDTIKQDFDLDIHHYVEIDFKGFMSAVDTLGGVPMYFDRPMRDTNSGLFVYETGCRRLDGEQALAFARARHLQYQDKRGWHDDPTGDLGRISRQHLFLRKVFDEARSKARHADVRAINGLVDAAVQNVTLDQTIDMGKAVALVRRFAAVEGDAIETFSLPVIPYTTAGGAAVVRVDATEAQPILNLFRGEPADDFPPSQVRFTISHESGQQSAATDARAAFEGLGFSVTAVKSGAPMIKRTTIRYAPGGLRIAQEIARHLPGGADLVEDRSYGDGRVVLQLGRDWAGVTAEAAPLPSAAAGPGDSGLSVGTVGTVTSPGGWSAAADDAVGVVPGEPPEGVTCD
jgi:LCP family protein required for cell wall assembly